MKESQLEQHASFILEQYAAGSRQTSIRRELKARGVETSQQNLSKWIARRVASIQERALKLGQVPPQPVAMPQKMTATPSAVPASGTTQPVASDTPNFNQEGLTVGEHSTTPSGRPMFGKPAGAENSVIKAALNKMDKPKRLGL